MTPIFILSLKGSPRLSILKRRLNHIGLKYKIIYGINGNDVKNHKLLKKIYNKKIAEFNLGRKMANSEIAASYGHIKIFKKIIKDNIPKAIILEDDAWPSKSLATWAKKNCSVDNINIISFHSYNGFVKRKVFVKLLNKFNIHIAETHLHNNSAFQIDIDTCKKIIKLTKGKVINVPDWPINFINNNITSSIALPYLVVMDDNNFSFIQKQRQKLVKTPFIQKILPKKIMNFLLIIYYIFFIPYLIRRYPNINFYIEYFFNKKISLIKNFFLNNLIRTEDINLNKNYYTTDIRAKLQKKIAALKL
jgi:GR25 family glycosyltransferase involved in LPS biosynthesis